MRPPGAISVAGRRLIAGRGSPVREKVFIGGAVDGGTVDDGPAMDTASGSSASPSSHRRDRVAGAEGSGSRALVDGRSGGESKEGGTNGVRWRRSARNGVVD